MIRCYDTHITTIAFEQIKIPLDKLRINQKQYHKCKKMFLSLTIKLIENKQKYRFRHPRKFHGCILAQILLYYLFITF